MSRQNNNKKETQCKNRWHLNRFIPSPCIPSTPKPDLSFCVCFQQVGSLSVKLIKWLYSVKRNPKSVAHDSLLSLFAVCHSGAHSLWYHTHKMHTCSTCLYKSLYHVHGHWLSRNHSWCWFIMTVFGGILLARWVQAPVEVTASPPLNPGCPLNAEKCVHSQPAERFNEPH